MKIRLYIVLLLLILNIVLLLKIRNINTLNKASINEMKSNYSESLFRQISLYNKLFQNYSQVDSIFNITSSENNFRMIYRYFNKECYKCVLADLDLIKKWGSKIGFENIIVLPNIPKNKNEKILLQTTLENLFYYSVECSNFRIDPGSKIDQRFFAIIDRNGFAKFIFFPQSNNIDISNEYFESMSIMFDENSDTVF